MNKCHHVLIPFAEMAETRSQYRFADPSSLPIVNLIHSPDHRQPLVDTKDGPYRVILILGLFVAAILVAMYLPMFDLMNVVGGGQ